jgi:hypothetical protein
MRLARAVIPLLVSGLVVGCGASSAPQTVTGGPTSQVASTAPTIGTQDEPATTTPNADRPPQTPATGPLDEPATTTPNADRPPQTPATGPLTTPPTARGADPYLPVGLPDPVFPLNTRAYELLQQGQCGPLLRQITEGEPPKKSWAAEGVPEAVIDLYTAASLACLSRWAEARAAFERISTSTLCLNPAHDFETVEACQEQRLAVHRWTEDLLEAHDADPSFVPNFPTSPTG